jgi:hypothetical protein
MMKKTTTIIATFILVSVFSCNNDREKEDESQYLDKDPDCDIRTVGKPASTCCDVEGRVFVETNNYYKYTYKGGREITNVNWTVISGSIILVDGQGTGEATFYFDKNFTTGKISGYGKVGSFDCQSTIIISKL